eukprot:scaffold51563_cov31-Tisochrysis_lutea.AAC.1
MLPAKTRWPPIPIPFCLTCTATNPRHASTMEGYCRLSPELYDLVRPNEKAPFFRIRMLEMRAGHRRSVK